MRRATAGPLLALGLWAAAGAAVMARPATTPVELTPAALYGVGETALGAGKAGAAREVALALLARDPRDFAALLLRARAARALGAYPEALAAVQAAWRLADTPDKRFAAARVRAQVLSSSGRRTAAQLWLRRAVEAAPNPQARAVAVRDYGYVRSRNPWALQATLSLSPSSNVNNGSSSSTSDAVLLGFPGTIHLSPDAQALSGFVAELGVGAVYRLPPGARRRTEFRFAGDIRHNRLSAASKAAAPAARGSAYDFGAVEIGIRQELRRSVEALSVYHWTATLGRNWYGGAPLADYLRLGLGGEHPLSPALTALWDVSHERQNRRDDATRSADIDSAEAGLGWRTATGDRLRLTFGARDARSAEPSIAHHAVFAELAWSKARPVAGIALALALSAERARYGSYAFAPFGRRDVTWTAELTLVFTRLSYLGFSPSLDVRYSRSASNVGLYRSTQAGLLLGFRSQF